MQKISFQELILKLQQYWQEQGCAILQPYDMEMGAGTFHPATVLRCLGSKPWNVVYVQPSRRPTDSRYGEHPSRMQLFYQLQVILKPSPDNMQELYLKSLEYIGINIKEHDIRFIEDDWESPTIGASGLGWEVWCDGMEVSQFTYMQQIGGIECRPAAGEITYGLERIALYMQAVDSAQELDWNGQTGDKALKYKDIASASEYQCSKYNLEIADTSILLRQFEDAEKQCIQLIDHQLPIPAYEHCIKASHLFNLLCARGVISVTERAAYIGRVRNLAKICCKTWVDQAEKEQ
ncbi:MAG TPA: glycine--tRNA ligase subunit alpha [Candidatus Megaira endosymbiont of Nemacystus decipiens]|nr:glycine--tRNA ligase subunit alpha [Candidatus Megaera endosymbiont of Nemacystus decipiens]